MSIVAGITDVWGFTQKDPVPAAKGGVVTQSVAPPAGQSQSCWRTAPRRHDAPDFAVCLSSNLELNEHGEVRAFPGAWVLVNIEFVNSGSTQLDNVVLRAESAPGVNVDTNSAMLISSKTPGGAHLTSAAGNALLDQGVNIGSYASNGNGYISFYMRVAGNDAFDCGTSRRVVSAHADTTAGSKGTDLVIAVRRNC